MAGAEVFALPEAMLERLRYVYRCAAAPQSAQQLWDVHSTPAEHELLGGNLEDAWRKDGTISLWMKARSTSFERAVLDVGFKLGFLATGEYESFLVLIRDHVHESIERHHLALQRYQLFITEVPREVFWRGTALPVDWHRQNAAWCYLLELVGARLRNDVLDHMSRDGRDPTALSKKKSRLSQTAGMPIEFLDRIVAAGTGSQRLDIPAEQIRVVRMADGDDLL